MTQPWEERQGDFPLAEIRILGVIALSGKDLAYVQSCEKAKAAGAGSVS